MSASFRIGDLAKQTGVKVVTIRFYEQSRLLPACERTAGNYRVYGQDHLQRLHFVRRCRELGFSIEQIRELVQLSAAALPTCADLCCLAADHLRDVESKIADLKRMAKELRRIGAFCDGKQPSAECGIVAVLSGASGRSPVTSRVGSLNPR
jgi:DNA-binding transcriptional MerR regulator